jgi:cardiolipin synthase
MLESLTWAAVIGFTIDWIIRIGFIIYIPRKRNPNSAISWLLVLFLLPGLGLLLFLVIGNPRLSKNRRKMQQKANKLIEQVTGKEKNELASLSTDQQNRANSLAELSKSLTKLPAKAGNSIEIQPEYDESIKDLVKEVKKSKEFVHIEYFIIALDKTTMPLFDAMKEAVERGVKVRLLVDGMGYRAYPRRKEMKKLLTDIGVEWYEMLPLRLRPSLYNRPDLRNHRKIVVIDDRVAYIGSLNMIDRSYHRKDDIRYDELVAKMNGPVVRQASAIFASDWYFETGELLQKIVNPKYRKLPKKSGNVVAQIVPSGSGFENSNNSRLFVALMYKAKERVVITNPYFVPDEAMLEAVTTAALRGVDVSIINSMAMDQWMVGHAQRSFYDQLMRAGVKIYLYKYPKLLHSKHITIDDDIAVVGSSNMDIRSFQLNQECVVIAYDKKVVASIKKVQAKNIASSDLVDINEWDRRSTFNKFLDSLARLTSALQ